MSLDLVAGILAEAAKPIVSDTFKVGKCRSSTFFKHHLRWDSVVIRTFSIHNHMLAEGVCLFVPNVTIPYLTFYLVGSATVVGQELQERCTTRSRPPNNKELSIVLANVCVGAWNKTYHFTRIDLTGYIVKYVLE